MTIIDQIKEAHLKARKARNQETLTTLTTLIGAIEDIAKKDGQRAVTDKDCIKTLDKFMGSAKETAGYAKNFNNTDGFNNAMREHDLYAIFMPAAKPQLSEEALLRTVRSIIASRLSGDGAKPKMGVVIADLKALHEGEYDGKAAAGVVKAELEKTAEPG
ncbi:GatB/YqeY domain-containing protein [Acinetobacter sp.]|uniref:GatB/YqeY domain-containing protein n=1 Tax=Acinetobacter sp. TaxID=472 RepID=UPI003890A366